MSRIAALVSGGGRTVLNFLDEIEAGRLDAEVVLVIADRECRAVDRLRSRGATVERIFWAKGMTPEDWGARAWPRIGDSGADLVCNCGFLRLLTVPDAWRGRIMNIHPGLLPKYGGKGMWGDHVHNAVLAAGERESGCTVHFVDAAYDTGPIILQRKVPVRSDDNVHTLAARVFDEECVAYPEAIRLFGAGRLKIEEGKVVIQ